MICGSCGEAPASVFIKTIVDNKVSPAALCLACSTSAASSTALAPLLKLLSGRTPKKRRKPPPKQCSCGLRYSDFRKTGRFGCPRCYESFATPLKHLLKQIHGSFRHRGKAPPGLAQPRGDRAGSEELKSLRGRLDAAVAKEDFEEAVRLRDRIQRLEKGS